MGTQKIRKDEMNPADVLIVGSGPAAISAAFPLVEAGLRVTMVDAAEPTSLPAAPLMDIGNFRHDETRWAHTLGRDLAGTQPLGNRSPKFLTPLARAVLAQDPRFPSLRATNFLAVRSGAAGGLSNIWGAFTAPYNEDDLKNFPFTLEALLPSYRAVAERIGLSGGDADLAPALPMQPANWLQPFAQKLLQLYKQQKEKAHPDFQLSIAPNAVATMPLAGSSRQACNSCGLCLYGCTRGAIYNSALELPVLQRFANFTYLPGHAVMGLQTPEDGLQGVTVQTHEKTFFMEARKIILAAGTLNTTALVLNHYKVPGKKLRLLSNPVAAMAFIDPLKIGQALPSKSFSLGQLSYQLGSEHHLASGALYGADTLPLTGVADRLPFSRPTAMAIAAALAPALTIATCFLPGCFSSNVLSLENGWHGPELSIEGCLTKDASKTLAKATERLSQIMRNYGLFQVPGSFSLVPPGADAHPAGTLPMQEKPDDFTCSPEGELRPWKHVLVVDGACFSDLPSKHCTFTIMANADRIARLLTEKINGR